MKSYITSLTKKLRKKVKRPKRPGLTLNVQSYAQRIESRFQKMHKLLTAKNTSFSLRYCLLECYVFSVLFLRCETWTLTKILTQRLEACEMWMFRRMEGISLKARISNEEVLNCFNTSRSLIPNIKSRKLSYFGHIKRHDSVMKNILEGRLEETRA